MRRSRLTRLQRRKLLWRASRGGGSLCDVWPMRLVVRVRGVNLDYSAFYAFCEARGISMPREYRMPFSMEARVIRISYPAPDPSLWAAMRVQWG